MSQRFWVNYTERTLFTSKTFTLYNEPLANYAPLPAALLYLYCLAVATFLFRLFGSFKEMRGIDYLRAILDLLGQILHALTVNFLYNMHYSDCGQLGVLGKNMERRAMLGRLIGNSMTLI